MNPKDSSVLRGIVIGSLRQRFTYKELLLKIVSVDVRGSRATVNIVYNGRALKAEVAAHAAYAIVDAMSTSYRLRKLTYIVITVSKVSSRRGSRFLVSLRVPRSLYIAIARAVRVLRERGVNMRNWSVKHTASQYPYKVILSATSSDPNADVRKLLEELSGLVFSRLNTREPFCVSLSIKTKRGSKSETKCFESLRF